MARKIKINRRNIFKKKSKLWTLNKERIQSKEKSYYQQDLKPTQIQKPTENQRYDANFKN